MPNIGSTTHSVGPSGMTSGGRVSTGTRPTATTGRNTNPSIASTISGEFAEPESANPLPEIPQSQLDLNVADDNYKPHDSKGLNEQRPEIIAEFDFEPAFDDGMDKSVVNVKSAIADAIDLQVSARQLRAENIIRLMNELKADPKTKPIIEELERKLKQSDDEVEREVRFLGEVLQKSIAAKRSLSVKFNEGWIREDILTRDRTATGTDPVKRVMIDLLRFSEDGFKSFTDTKILLQLLDDLRSILRSFSPQLIDRPDGRRASDTASYAIQRMTDPTGGSTTSFDVSTIKSIASDDVRKSLFASSLIQFQDSLRTLSSSEDRLKMLFAIMSKELRVSVGLSIPSVRSTIRSSFGLSDPQLENDVFDNILGIPGASIFDEAEGPPGALVHLLKVDTEDGDTILPFEPTFIKRGNKVIISGQKFYVDSILKGHEKFRTEPFENYSKAFSGKVSALANIIEGTFDVNVVNSQELGLNADDVFSRFLRSVQPIVKELETATTQHDTFFISLLRLAADDALLKHMLYLYILWVGINGSQQMTGSRGFFDALARAGKFNEGLGTSPGLSAVLAGNENLLASVTNAIELLQPSAQVSVSVAVGDELPDPIGQYPPPPPPDITGDSSLDIISKMMLERIFTLVHEEGKWQALSSDPTLVAEFNTAILDRFTTLGEGDPSFILRSMVEFINTIDRLARGPLGTGTYMSVQRPGLTKFNNLGAHTIVWLVIEMYTTFFKMFPLSTFIGAERGTTNLAGGPLNEIIFFSSKNSDLINDTATMLEELVPPPGLAAARQNRFLFRADEAERERQLQLQSNIDRFQAIRQKFQEEDRVIRGITNIFLAVGNGLKRSSAELVRTFDLAGPNGPVIEEIQGSIDFNEKLSALGEAQVTLSRNAMAEQRATRQSSVEAIELNNDATSRVGSLTPFVDDTTLTPSVKAALLGMLRTPTFTAPGANNLRILSVGLPSGFLESLQERIGTFLVGQNIRDFKQRLGIQSDVIRVNVYMQDLLFEDVVFKPKSFIFELGRFAALPDFSAVAIDDPRSFDALVREAITTRVLSVDGSTFVTERGSTIASDKGYDGVLTADEKAQMAKNHVTSYLLRVYLKLLTGVDLSEENFYMNDQVADMRIDPESQVLFESLVTTRVSGFAGRRVTLDELRASNENVRDLLSRLSSDEVTAGVVTTLGQILEDASKVANVEISEDLVTFMKAFSPSSVLFGAGARRIRSTSPKLFERIFNVVVDPDEFEVDHALTTSTSAGQSFMASRAASVLLVPIEDRFLRTIDVSRQTLNGLRPVRFDPIVRRELGDISLQQFFVSIEQVPELATLPIVFERGVPRIASAAAAQFRANQPAPPRDLTFESGAPVRTNIASDPNRRSQSSTISTSNEGVDWSRIL